MESAPFPRRGYWLAQSGQAACGGWQLGPTPLFCEVSSVLLTRSSCGFSLRTKPRCSAKPTDQRSMALAWFRSQESLVVSKAPIIIRYNHYGTRFLSRSASQSLQPGPGTIQSLARLVLTDRRLILEFSASPSIVAALSPSASVSSSASPSGGVGPEPASVSGREALASSFYFPAFPKPFSVYQPPHQHLPVVSWPLGSLVSIKTEYSRDRVRRSVFLVLSFNFGGVLLVNVQTWKTKERRAFKRQVRGRLGHRKFKGAYSTLGCAELTRLFPGLAVPRTWAGPCRRCTNLSGGGRVLGGGEGGRGAAASLSVTGELLVELDFARMGIGMEARADPQPALSVDGLLAYDSPALTVDAAGRSLVYARGINGSYWAIPTYPESFVVFRAVSSRTLLGPLSKFRSHRRIATLVWRDAESGAMLWRSSQPLTGLGRVRRSRADERLLEAIVATTPSRGGSDPVAQWLWIIDCRPYVKRDGECLAGEGVRE